METETFISEECLVCPMKGWDEMSWEDIYKEHPRVVDDCFETDERINYLNDMYSKSVIDRAKERCVEGLGDLVDGFRQEHPSAVEPQDIDWPLFLWHRDNKPAIRKRLENDSELKKAMGEYNKMYVRNISICMAQEYNTLVNDRNCATYIK